jgi:hypothetical protein
MFVLTLLLAFIGTPTFANPGCKNGNFVGSYTTPSTFPDIWGDGSGVKHTFALQLNLHSDGTVYQEFTGFPDIMLSAGSGTPSIGSWQCRNDKKLVVTIITSGYIPTNDAPAHGVVNVPTDLILAFHSRITYLFSVTDDDTLTRVQARTRRYAPADDPTDPNGGTLLPLNTTSVVYKRLVASDADLLAP